MSTTLALPGTGNGTWMHNAIRPGVSRDALRLSERIKEFTLEFLTSATGQRRLLDPLERVEDLRNRCSSPNWNSEGASEISPAAFADAAELLGLLPTYLDAPEILPEPSGAIAFEWYRGHGRVFVLAVNGQRAIEFAALLGGGNEIHGRVNFDGMLPKRIQQDLSDFLGQ